MAEKERRRIALRLEGKERREEFACGTPPESRYTLFWDILKGRFGKLMLVNLCVLVSVLPIVGIAVFRYLTVSAQDVFGPFGAGLNVGYPAFPDVVGYAERSVFFSDMLYFALLIPASAIAAAGISGAMYLAGSLLRTQGVFVFKDFIHGIERGFFSVLEAALIGTVLLFGARLCGNYADWAAALGEPYAAWMIAAKIVSYLVFSLALLVCFWMISLGVTYRQGPLSLLRNALVLTFGTFPQTVLFAAVAAAPIFLVLFVSNTFLFSIGMVFYLLIGFSWFCLVWMTYSQWAFDKFIGVGEKAAVRAKETPQKENAVAKALAEKAAMNEYRRLVAVQGKSRLFSCPMKPIDDGEEPFLLSEAFSREDLTKVEESRRKMREDALRFENAHKDEERYAEYNRQFENREKALEGENKKKPKHPPKMLRRR